MSYSVFRIKGIKTTGDLIGLKKHNIDRISHTNHDIDKERTKDNITLIECDNYNKRFNDIVAPMKMEHEERMKTMRADRVKTFNQHINSSKNDVACEMVFTSDSKFFEGMSKNDISQWAEKSLDFVTKDLGIERKNIIHAVVHMDEDTPHLHVVAVPLVKTFNKKQDKEIWSISRRQYINGKSQLSKAQDIYNARMNENGYELERGEKGSGKKHKTTKDYKAEKLKEDINSLENKLKALESDLKAFEMVESSLDKIDSIKAKKSPLGAKISVKEDDYKLLIDLSKKSLILSSKVNALQEKVDNLESELDKKTLGIDERLQLNKLKSENKDLKNTISKANKIIGSMSKEFQNEFLKAKKEFEQPIQKTPKNKSKTYDLER